MAVTYLGSTTTSPNTRSYFRPLSGPDATRILQHGLNVKENLRLRQCLKKCQQRPEDKHVMQDVKRKTNPKLSMITNHNL